MAEQVLVTGGSGFLATQIIYQLLQKNYKVKTTLRSLDKKDEIIDTLKTNGIMDVSQLTFAKASLDKDDHWEEIMKDCTYVLSVASPVFMNIPHNEEEAMRPAKEGVIRILKAADEAKVKRVIMTANFGAVGFSNHDKNSITTEENWTNPKEKGLSVYEKSKLLAELVAWDFVKNKSKHIEFATINPVAMLGPSLSKHISGSFHLLTNLLNGTMKSVPHIPLNLVDVRDVADLHIRAMITEKANGERFIASSDGQISLPEIAKIIKEKRPRVAQNSSLKIVPNWVISIMALFSKKVKWTKLLISMNRNVSNQKAKNILGWKPISNNEEIILSSIDSMIKFGLVKE